MKFYYIANARMPTEKAHGIQIAKMCEAFIEEGVDLELIVPNRKNEIEVNIQEFYNLRVPVTLIKLPVLDFYRGGRFLFFISSFTFSVSYFFYMLWKRIKGKKGIIYTIDMDTFSFAAMPLIGTPIFTEMHCGKPDTFVLRFLFRHLKGVFAINKLIVDEFKQRFSESNTNYFVEPNGVDATLFSSRNKMEARQKLNIPQDLKMVLYLGRFFEWKGLEILPKAAEMTPNIEWYIVGGTEEEFYNITERITSSTQIHFMGGCEQAKVPLWFAAADALIVLGTKRDQQSYLYTSPMKLFEYLLSERCIVASDTPAIRQIVSNKEAFLYEPDSAEDLAAKVSEAVLRSPLILEKISKARKKGEIYSWSGRAKRIIKSIQNTLEHD